MTDKAGERLKKATESGATLVADPHGNGRGAAAGEDGRGLGAEERTEHVPHGLEPPGGKDREAEIAALMRRLLILLDEEPERPGLRRTPLRAAKALRWLTRGYQREAEDVIGSALFEERHESMVLVRDIELYSLCEHHMLPFYGRAHVAYVPDGHIIGLSKLARVVDVFARRLQVQERLTDEVADALVDALAPRGVGVIIEARHLCMMMRGVEKQNSRTVTSALRGEFADCPMTREEFLRLAHG